MPAKGGTISVETRQRMSAARTAYYAVRLTPKHCLICGQKITGPHRATSKYCSIPCRTQAQRHPATVACLHCGNLFQVRPGAAGTRKYCSASCHLEAQRRRVTLTCVQCGVQFEAKPCEVPSRKHCSTACYAQWRSDNIRGPVNPSWKGGVTPATERRVWVQNGGRQWRRICRQRDRHLCLLCVVQTEKRTRHLGVHHKASFTKYPELRSESANGASVCRHHHYWLHSNEGCELRERWENEALTQLGHLLAPAGHQLRDQYRKAGAK